MTGPDFHELIGDDLPAEEDARLRRVHDLLVQAGPPAELPPSLATAPAEREASVLKLPVRRRGAVLLIAAALVAAAFGGGYLVGHRHAGFTAERSITMHSTTGTQATASVQLADRDAAGNWPLRMVVSGLPNLGKKGYYELFLTRDRTRLASCGTFVVAGGHTVVQLNAPYLLAKGLGWVVVAHLRAHPKSQPILLTT